jgi:(2Fe-2S) ferredoxin
MHTDSIPYKKLVLVCGNVRTDGRLSCGVQGNNELKDRLKELCKARGLPVRVVQTSCLGKCDEGPNIMIVPDNFWLSQVTDADIPEIMKIIEVSLV